MAIGPTINDIKEITVALSLKLKLDYPNYAFSFLRRRLALVYSALKIKNADTFIEDIKTGKVLQDFCYFFPVGESELFRDPSFWRTLRTKILPSMGDNLSFWFPELVSAEELYSLLIILEEEKLTHKAKIFCNIKSSQRIEELKQGKISLKNNETHKSNFKRLELHSKYEDFFTEELGFAAIHEGLLQKVEFLNDNYFNCVPNQQIACTMFRNRMLYYNSKMQLQAEKYLQQCLGKGAFLVLGIKEQISKENEPLFDLFDNSEQIYQVL